MAYTGPFPHTNAGTITAITVSGTTFSGNIDNTGKIEPGGITVTSSTINGEIIDTGLIEGGISIGTGSEVGATVDAIIILNTSSFGGGISNSGTLVGSTRSIGYGILVDTVSTFSGSISNGGTITVGGRGGSGIGIFVDGVSNFAGNITNSGNVIGGSGGIVLLNSTINGAITDSGYIAGGIKLNGNSKLLKASHTGLLVTGSTFLGGISNSGTISVGGFVGIGIEVFGATNFSGGISNGGSISVVEATGIDVVFVTSFSNGIVNSGTISAGEVGIFLRGDQAFSGGISNSGNISGGSPGGIFVDGVSTFAGNISNSGSITGGAPSINIAGSNIDGAIIDSGYIADGIQIDDQSTLTAATGDAINVTGKTFLGGIINSATISATTGTGVFVESPSTFTGGITNSGTIMAGRDGIHVALSPAFTVNIINSIGGTISVHDSGIAVSLSTVSGSIENEGSINAATGVDVLDSTVAIIANLGAITATTIGIDVVDSTLSSGINAGVAGAIIDAPTGVNVVGSTLDSGINSSGLIVAASHGILIDSASKISAPAAIGIEIQGHTFSGGISSSGTIASGLTGVFVSGTTTFGGGITSAGTITATNGAGISLDRVTNFSGGINNSAKITSVKKTGILVDTVSSFSGGISNSSTIAAAAASAQGIFVEKGTSFSGSIVNAGAAVITTGPQGNGIEVQTVTAFDGGVANAGTIEPGNNGIFVSSVAIFGTSSVGGGITNTGTISGAGVAGINVSAVTTFIGGISNGGSINAGLFGIRVQSVTAFTLAATSAGGGIVNSGTITAKSHTGILVDGVSTFSGGITNTGSITGVEGIVVTNSGAVSIFDSGTITSSSGASGIAVDLSKNGTGDINTFTLGPGYSITGLVKGEGSDIFQLGGSGSGAFNLGSIGSRYTGFSSFDVVSANWALSGTGNENWTIEGGTLELVAGASITDHVSFDGTGTLGLDSGTNQIGGDEIIGAVAGDAIDLRFLAFASGEHAVWQQTSGSGGTLSLYSDGVDLASFTLTGQFNSLDFSVSSDGSGDSLITVQNTPTYAENPGNNDEWILSDGNWVESAGPGSHPSGYNVAGIGDWTGNGTDGILWFNPTTGDTDEWQLTNTQWAASVDLGTHPANATDGTSYQIAGTDDSTDFTGDGIDDVLWTSPNSNGTIATDIWELGSNGQWAASVSPGNHPAGYTVAGTGDWTGNGTDGILWFNSSTGDTDEWQLSGGQWSASVDLGSHPNNPTDGNAYQIAGVGDFFDNGIDDVLWTSVNSNGTVATDIWELNSSGQWMASGSPGNHPAGYSVVGVDDFTGTGTSDILWQNSATGDIDEWQISAGKWVASVDLGAHPGNTPVSGVGDFTGTGTSDILFHS